MTLRNRWPHVTMIIVQLLLLTSCTQQKQSLFRLLPAEQTSIDFINKIDESDTFNILTYEYIYNGGGVGIGDFNNDGLQDLFFAGNRVGNRLYLNRGKLAFEDVSSTAQITAPTKWNSGVTVVDINNDGWTDVYVTATMLSDSASRHNMLFINKGLNKDGIPVFEDQAKKYGIAYGGYSVMSAFLDYDRDGDLDLYILTNVKINNKPTTYREKILDGTSPNNDKLYRNNGDGTFTDVTFAAGIREEGFGLGLAISDFNRDGWPDIYVSNDYLSNDILYLNNRNGSFTNATRPYISHQSQFSMGNDAADINNDGLPDIITLDMLPENNLRKKTTIANKSYLTYQNNVKFDYDFQYVRNMMHLNNGASNGIKFSEIGQLAGVYQTEWSWSPLMADFDHDGWKDILITNGFPKDITDKDFAHYRVEVGNLATTRMLLDSIPVIRIPHYAFKNNGDLTFKDVSADWGLDVPSFSNAAAVGDLDNDGDMDYVVSNINDRAFVFENQLNQKKGEQFAYLKINCKGPSKNIHGIGTKVTISARGHQQFQENNVYRGFLSSIEPIIHFGLPDKTPIDSMLIEWPDGNTQVLRSIPVNQQITVEYTASKNNPVSWQTKDESLCADITKKANVKFVHEEEDLNDFSNQRTIPHKFSQGGPSVSVGDVNQDGLDDFVVGGSAGKPTSIFFQTSSGEFKPGPGLKNESKPQEDTGILLFDLDRDGDLDLLIASGGSPYVPKPDAYRLRYYENTGRGAFKESSQKIPNLSVVASCLRACDVDRDGDLDVFVGSRVAPNSYPLGGKSVLLRNDNGVLTLDTASEVTRDIGMINDAIWSDVNGDGFTDLLTVGEFTQVQFFKNENGVLKRTALPGLESVTGWWNSIVGSDVDQDGDIDFIVGNAGLNNPYHVDRTHPVVLYANDYDKNGSIDPILSCYLRTSLTDSTKKLFPMHFWDELNQQSPLFRRKFKSYEHYGKTVSTEIFTEQEKQGAVTLEANELHSGVIQNNGAAGFSFIPFDNLAQIGPLNGLLTLDANDDGLPDVVGVGNCYGNEVFSGRNDAMTGLLMTGNGNGSFTIHRSTNSGLIVQWDAKALAGIVVHGNYSVLASQNRDSLKVFNFRHAALRTFTPSPTDAYCILEFENGKKQKVEFYYGCGYLSQSSRTISIPRNVKKISVTDTKGNTRYL